MKPVLLSILIVLLFLSNSAPAQEFGDYSTMDSIVETEVEMDQTWIEEREQQDANYQKQTFSGEKIDKDLWEKKTKNINYEEEIPQMDLPDMPDIHIPSVSPLLSDILYALVIIILSVVLFMLIRYFVLKGTFRDWFQGIRKKKTNVEAIEDFDELDQIENIEKEIYESEFHRLLAEAIRNGNYRQAVRMYYLIILRRLSINNLIVWTRDKTNRNYLRELRVSEYHEKFKLTTRIYEKTWYGQYDIMEGEFAEIQPGFTTLIDEIKK